MKLLEDSVVREISSKSVLVTGATGLIGSTFVDLIIKINRVFDSGIIIWGLGRSKASFEKRFFKYIANNEKLHYIEADITDSVIPNIKVDYIIHAASPAHPLAYSQDPVGVMEANLAGTINMLKLAKEAKAKIVFISSGEIYGISSDPQSYFKEEDYGYVDILNPRSCYPESKRAAETLCASYYSQYGVRAVIARLCHVYGSAITERNSRADAQFLRNAANGQDIVMKSLGEQIRSFCYAKDAATALLYILAKGIPGEAYNVANKSSIASIREYAETLAEISGVSIRNEFPEEAEVRGYSLVSRAVLDASKLENLGWTPCYNLKEGLLDTYTCLKK